jgi:UDP-glucose 4-epimerase
MRYLITGGAGFIGSHLAEKLINSGDEVIVLDNFSTGKVQNINSVAQFEKFSFFEGSVLDIQIVEKLVESVDKVIHLAAAVGVFNILNKPLSSLMLNVHGTETVLTASHKYGKELLLASTSEIYGKNSNTPLHEQSDRVLGSPLLSRWSYSEAKAIDESLSYFYFQEKGLPVKIVRLFNTVGPRQVGSYGMVIPRFIEAALRNETIRVFGTGHQIRSFCHIQDVVRAIELIIFSESSTGQVFNVGSDDEISILELAKKIKKLTNSNSEIITVPYEDAYARGFEEIPRRVPDISKIKSALGWNPELSLDQIISDVLKFMESC